MDWNSQQFVWLDWAIIVAGVALVAWAVYRAVQKGQTHATRSRQRRLPFRQGRTLVCPSAPPSLRPTSVRSTW